MVHHLDCCCDSDYRNNRNYREIYAIGGTLIVPLYFIFFILIITRIKKYNNIYIILN